MAAKQQSIDDLLLGLQEKVQKAASAPNINRYKPHPKQTSFHKSQYRSRLFLGGNRTGKTVSNVVECIWWLTKTHPYRTMPMEPVRGRLVCVSLEDGLKKIILPLFKQWLPSKYLIDGSWEKSYDKQSRTLTLSNDSFIEFMSYDQDLEKFAGTSRHFVSFDEEPPKDIWIECRARLVDTRGSWWISMTPVEGLTWIYDDIYEPWEFDSANSPVFIIQADMADNPYITEEAREEFLSSLSPEERAAREKGEFINLGGLVFKKFSSEVHRIDREDFKITPSMRIYTSVDVGWAHPTAWLWHAVEPNGHVITFHEMIESFVTISEWAKRVLEFERSYGINSSAVIRTGDPAMKQTRSNTGVNDITEYAMNGIYLSVDSVPRAVDIGLNRIEDYMKPDDDPRQNGRPMWQYVETCAVFESQMRKLRWDTYASKRMNTEKGPKGTIRKIDDDGPDSFRYFMTLMPDLKFSIVRDVPQRRQENPLNAAPMFNTDSMMLNEPVNNWQIEEEYDLWTLEG